MAYDGLLLDFDGVVVDVMGDADRIPKFRAQIERQSATAGLHLDSSAIETLAHSVSHDTLEAISERVDAAPESIWELRDNALETVLTDAARTGAKAPYADVTALGDIELPLGIASNNQHRVVETILTEFELAERFGAIRAREPTPASLRQKKPAPTFLDDAMAELGVENPLFVGDKESDIVAGQQAGIETAYIRREHNFDRRIEADPAYEVESLTEVADILASK